MTCKTLSMEYQSPLSRLYHWEKTNPDKIFLKQPIDNTWHTWTWKQAASEVRQLAAAIKALDFPPASNIALLSKNSAHWMICDLAIMMSGHVSVPVYPNSQSSTLRQILEHSESKMLFVGKLDGWHLLRAGVPDNLPCIAMPFCKVEGCTSWETFSGNISPLQDNIDRGPDELATIVYTSGTTGTPKGVMFNFSSFSFVAHHAIRHLKFNHYSRFFSYLPLSHIAERVLVETISLYVGGEVSFAESLQSFSKNLQEAKPTVFLGVHRIWSKFQEGILAKIPQQKLDVLLSIPVVSLIVKRKIVKGLGLNEASMVLTGAAPTPVSLINWFKRLGIQIQEAYAMTENCCYSHVSLKENGKVGYVGQPLPLVEVRLGEENEIQIRHGALMAGYYKEQEKTAEVLTEDGFLKTGDEGFIDEDSFLKITGRVKDLFKTAKGKYVAPSPIEMKLMSNSDIGQVCVVGSGMPQPMAISVLSERSMKKEWNEIETTLKTTLRQINKSLEAHEKIAKIVVVGEDWTVENNLLTPSFKIKRNQVEKMYAPYYDLWNDNPATIVRQAS